MAAFKKIKTYRFTKQDCAMLKNDLKVQVSDTRGDDSSNAVEQNNLIKISLKKILLYMNLQTMHKQRKFIFFASLAGVISVFLPWITISFMGNTVESINGFRSYGIVVFLGFIVAGALAIMGGQTQPLEKTNWLACMGAGAVALLFAIVAFSNGIGNMIMVAGSHGFGIWVALAAAAGIILFAWMYRNPVNNLKDSFDSFKKSISIPSNIAPKPTATSSTERIAELERLSKLKDNGSITEEEFKQLKSKIL